MVRQAFKVSVDGRPLSRRRLGRRDPYHSPILQPASPRQASPAQLDCSNRESTSRRSGRGLGRADPYHAPILQPASPCQSAPARLDCSNGGTNRRVSVRRFRRRDPYSSPILQFASPNQAAPALLDCSDRENERCAINSGALLRSSRALTVRAVRERSAGVELAQEGGATPMWMEGMRCSAG